MPADVLDRLLITLAVRLHAFALCQIMRGWRLVFDPMDAVTIHYVLAGSGTLRVGTSSPVRFTRHSMMVVPANLPQSLEESGPVVGESRAGNHGNVIDDGLVTFTAGDGGRDLLVICGTISASYAGAFGLFDYLHEPIVQDVSSEEIFRHAFELLLAEASRPGLGTQALCEALMKQCLILLLRRHLVNEGIASPFFGALKDERLARAVTAILERPAFAHTVDSLARVSGMSRSSFAESFSRTFGTGPIEFVQRVRLRLAAHLLGSTDLPVKVVASSIGYSSRSYFSRAFRGAYGVDPSTFRVTGGSAEEEPSAIANEGTAVLPGNRPVEDSA
ncbi:MAG: helix-turn-helix transcriptional regulator [Pyrinomonadaceae bacterium]|nr:helix-turn-helix transcriptional regulator [Phycisphaerales bacterium]